MKQLHIFLFVLVFVIVLAGAGTLTLLKQTVDPKDKNQHIFVVNQGEGVNAIAKRLEQEGFIRNRFVFLLEVKRLGLGTKIQAGDFRLSKSMAPAQIAKELTTGTLDVWVQIIEGWRAEEVGAVLKEKVPTYENSWVLALKKQEGKLFPDTYLIPKNADIALVIKILAENFDRKIENLKPNVGKNGLTLEQNVTLASIVEREALFDEDRPLIAGVLLNRLQLGMALQADATVQYALGFQPQEKDWWKKNLTKEDLTINSPFNTYRFPGLPPKPIANPGLASIKASLNPTDTDYLYYIHDKTGKTHFAKTLDEHNENIRKYLN